MEESPGKETGEGRNGKCTDMTMEDEDIYKKSQEQRMKSGKNAKKKPGKQVVQ